jgi:phenylacetate-CoA ligase
MLSRRPVPDHGRLTDVSSSGSTGHPVTVRTTGFLNMMAAVCNWRAQQWAGLDWSKDMVAVMAEQNRQPGTVLGPWGPPWLAQAKKGRMIYTTYDTDNHLRLDLMADRRAAYLAATPGGFSVLADMARAEDRRIRLEAVLSRGNKATPFIQQEMAEVFGARTIEQYSSKECGTIAHPCAAGDGWHVNAEAMLVEILDDNNEPVAPGEEGRAIITPFGMSAFPLIRYDQGDRLVQGGPCRCGRILPHFHEIAGRVRDDFLRPNGEVIPDLSMEARVALGAGRWQVAKVGEHSYEVRYVPRDWGTARDPARFMALFRQAFYDEAVVRCVEVTDLALNANAKFKERTLEWHP